jgi:endonuclease/exonuclease/phosphatase family metal-dependent hydrolase
MWDGCFGSLDTSDGGAADCMALKGFTLTRATLADGVTVDVYDLHGEAGGTAGDQALQADDYAQLAAFVNRFSAGRAVLVGGDTNLHTDGTHPDASGTADREIWQSFLAATGLADACAGLPCGDAIDKFAVRAGGGVTLTARSPLVDDSFVRPDGTQLSDHRPVAVVIDWAAS